MKILVCVKQVPDTETNIQIKDGKVDLASVNKWILNPYDLFAVEEAVQLKEKVQGSSVHVMTLGPSGRVKNILFTAIAMGCDEATIINTDKELDTNSVAKALAAAAKKTLSDFDVVFTGKSAIDDSAASVSQQLAHYLDIPHTTVVSKTDFGSDSVTVEREVEGGAKEIVELKFPALLAANKGLNKPRRTAIPAIMKAKKKPISEIDFETLEVSDSDIKVTYSGFEPPPDRPQVQMLEGDPKDQSSVLVKKLREEAKVI